MPVAGPARAIQGRYLRLCTRDRFLPILGHFLLVYQLLRDDLVVCVAIFSERHHRLLVLLNNLWLSWLLHCMVLIG